MSFLRRLFGGRPDPVTLFNRGATKCAKGDLDGAIADHTKAIKIKPDFMAAYVMRGVAKKAKGDLDGAIADYTKAIELQPDNVAAYVNRGAAKHAKGDLDDAVADYTKAIELKPDFADSYRNRGFAKLTKGDLDGAIADYTKAIELKPSFVAAYYYRGKAKRAKGDLAGAIADYTKAIGPAPQVKCPTCGTTYRLGDDAMMVTSQDVANSFQRGGGTIIGRDGPIAGEAWSPVATQTRPALIGRKRNLGHLTEAEVLESVTALLENVSRIRETIKKGSKAFWYCEKCRHNQQPHAFPSDF